MMTKRIVVGPMHGVVAMGAVAMVGVVGVGAVLLWTGCARQADPNPSSLEAVASDASQAGDADRSVREVDAQPSVSAADAEPVYVGPIEVEPAPIRPVAIKPVAIESVVIEPVDDRVSDEPPADALPTVAAATPAPAPSQTKPTVPAAAPVHLAPHVATDFRGVIGIGVQGEAFVGVRPQPSSARPPSGQPGARATVVVGAADIALDPETGFAVAAFPPTLTDRDWHQNAWLANNCMDCHETGVGDAVRVRHIGLPAIALASSCRTCHTIAPGKLNPTVHEEPTLFAPNAFPPMIPNNSNHRDAWGKDSCLLCHQSGIRGAPIVRHAGMAKLLLEAKCRTCHVQVRAHQDLPLVR